jgi:hypothetical protein
MPNDTPAAIYAARELERRLNGPMQFTAEAGLTTMLAPNYVLYIFNIGPMSWKGVNAISKGSAGRYEIQPCERGRPFSKPIIIPSIVVDTYMIEDEIKTHSVTGEFMCQDIVHPMLGQNWSWGQNLDDFGVFWTRNNPPTNAELEQARAKMEATFRLALTEASGLEAAGTTGPRDITPLMRYAADYFEEDRPWNRIYRKTAECPACGGPTKPGTAVHTCGAVLDWPSAIKFGLKTKEQAAAAGIVLEQPNGAGKVEKKKKPEAERPGKATSPRAPR